MQRLLIGLGLALLIAGLLWPVLQRIGFGRLPGDIAIARGGIRFYAPITTCLIVSAVLSLLLWFLRR